MAKKIMDILEEIEKEHDEFKELISSIENSKDNKKKEFFEELYNKLIGHHESEEYVLFPDVMENSNKDGKDIVMEMIEEHSLASYQLNVIQKTSLFIKLIKQGYNLNMYNIRIIKMLLKKELKKCMV